MTRVGGEWELNYRWEPRCGWNIHIRHCSHAAGNSYRMKTFCWIISAVLWNIHLSKVLRRSIVLDSSAKVSSQREQGWGTRSCTRFKRNEYQEFRSSTMKKERRRFLSLVNSIELRVIRCLETSACFLSFTCFSRLRKGSSCLVLGRYKNSKINKLLIQLNWIKTTRQLNNLTSTVI